MLRNHVDSYLVEQDPDDWALALSRWVPWRMRSAWRVWGPPGVDYGAEETWWQWRGRQWRLRRRVLGSPATS